MSFAFAACLGQLMCVQLLSPWDGGQGKSRILDCAQIPQRSPWVRNYPNTAGVAGLDLRIAFVANLVYFVASLYFSSIIVRTRREKVTSRYYHLSYRIVKERGSNWSYLYVDANGSKTINQN